MLPYTLPSNNQSPKTVEIPALKQLSLYIQVTQPMVLDGLQLTILISLLGRLESYSTHDSYVPKSNIHSSIKYLLTACMTELTSCVSPTTFHKADNMQPAKILLVPRPDPFGRSDHV